MIKRKMLTSIDADRDSEIPRILNRENAKVGVEIGVFKGQFSKHIMENWDGKLYMIDPWRPLGNEYMDASNHKNHLNAYQEAIDNIKGFENRAFMLRGLSNELVDLFSDESLDFVYIYGNHTYKYVKEDIELWYPKIKQGGLLMGHDYLSLDWYDSTNPMHENGIDKHMWFRDNNKPDGDYNYTGVFGVNPAVDEFCEEHDLTGTVTNEYTGSFIIYKT